MSKKQGCVSVPANWKKKIETGEMKREYGLSTSSGSRWAFLRSRGCSDTQAQYICYKERKIIKDTPKLRSYAIDYHNRDDKSKGHELYLASNKKEVMKMFKKDFGKDRIIHWIEER